jgi:hypothetical protein
MKAQDYRELYRQSLEGPTGFWGDAAQTVDWSKPCERCDPRSPVSLAGNMHAAALGRGGRNAGLKQRRAMSSPLSRLLVRDGLPIDVLIPGCRQHLISINYSIPKKRVNRVQCISPRAAHGLDGAPATLRACR